MIEKIAIVIVCIIPISCDIFPHYLVCHLQCNGGLACIARMIVATRPVIMTKLPPQTRTPASCTTGQSLVERERVRASLGGDDKEGGCSLRTCARPCQTDNKLLITNPCLGESLSCHITLRKIKFKKMRNAKRLIFCI